MSGDTISMFCDRGVSFQEILHDGKLGGANAILSYLDIRIKHLNRSVEDIGEAGQNGKRIALAVHAMREAQQFVLSTQNARKPTAGS